MTQSIMTLAAYALGIAFWLLVAVACIAAMVAAFEYAIDCYMDGGGDDAEAD